MLLTLSTLLFLGNIYTDQNLKKENAQPLQPVKELQENLTQERAQPSVFAKASTDRSLKAQFILPCAPKPKGVGVSQTKERAISPYKETAQPSPRLRRAISPKGDIEKPIVVLILSYNNKDWYKKNLDSVFNQNYENYRIVYVNDASTDGTGQLVEQYVKACGQQHRTTIVHNTTNQGAMANQYKSVHFLCQDDEIIAHLDGDDWFKHENALNTVNCAYQDTNVWLTYGQFERLRYKADKKTTYHIKGQCRPVEQEVIEKNIYRESPWVTSALRTFYAGLLNI